MRIDTDGFIAGNQRTTKTTKLWLTAQDTYTWANRPGALWPCSTLAGKTLYAEFDGPDLVAMSVDDGHGDQDIPADEFNAITSDFLTGMTQ